MSKHTPGPWRVANGVQIRSQRDQIAKVWMMRDGEGKANAALIAAAPDLYKALVQVRDRFFAADQPERDRDLMWGSVNAAIAKAEGQQ